MKTANLIQWSCAEGVLKGVIKEIQIEKNAKDEFVPWIIIRTKKDRLVRLCASDMCIQMFKMKWLDSYSYDQFVEYTQ